MHAGDWASTVPDLLVAEGRMGVALDEDPATGARRARGGRGRGVRRRTRSSAASRCASQWWGGQFASGRSSDEALARDRAARPRSGAAVVAPAGHLRRPLRQRPAAAGAPHLPTVQYGPGDTSNAHAPDEHITRAELEAATRALAVLYVEHCGAV